MSTQRSKKFSKPNSKHKKHKENSMKEHHNQITQNPGKKDNLKSHQKRHITYKGTKILMKEYIWL